MFLGWIRKSFFFMTNMVLVLLYFTIVTIRLHSTNDTFPVGRILGAGQWYHIIPEVAL